MHSAPAVQSQNANAGDDFPWRLDPALLPPRTGGDDNAVMLDAALHLASEPGLEFGHLGRGPQVFDWLGLARCCAQAVRDRRAGRPFKDIADCTAYGPAGPHPQDVWRLLESWGLMRTTLVGAPRGALILFPTDPLLGGVLAATPFAPLGFIVTVAAGGRPQSRPLDSLARRQAQAFVWRRA